ncbi:MAG: histidinol-phosphatase [Gammaproteobacteria bacterium]|nr:histidinol-phosphatase [Gammaproteobacteria bacterium]
MTSGENSESLRETAIAAATAGGRETLKWFRQPIGVENKATGTGFDPVTAADRACERVIREHIQAQFPDHAIRGEEFDDVGSSEWTWLIDPIDGTRAFISGFVHWGVLLGLLLNDKPFLGVMAQPFLGEVFVGDGQNASYMRGGESTEINTRETQNLKDATFATTDPRLFKKWGDQRVLERIESNVRLVRYGTDCYQYAMVALGQLDLVVENVLKPWDILPLVPIVRGAGGVLTNWQGGDDLSDGYVIASANQTLHDQALERINAD